MISKKNMSKKKLLESDGIQNCVLPKRKTNTNLQTEFVKSLIESSKTKKKTWQIGKQSIRRRLGHSTKCRREFKILLRNGLKDNSTTTKMVSSTKPKLSLNKLETRAIAQNLS